MNQNWKSNYKKSIFEVELPVVEKNNDLKIIRKIYSQYDEYFIASGCIEERKKQFNKLWQRFAPYADKHFLKEIKNNFHKRTWEMYLGNVLIEKNFEISSRNEGPDFIVNDQIYLECIAPTKGDSNKPNSVPPISVQSIIVSKKQLDIAQDIPAEKMILRITQAFKDKACDQYKSWKTKSWFNNKKPFVIAINTGDLEYPQDYMGIPLVIKALFGLEFLQISQYGGKNFNWRNEIPKNNSSVPVNYFTSKKFKFVSGIIFSEKKVLDHPKIIGDDCVFVNNPFAKYSVDKNFVNNFKNWEITQAESGLNLKKNY